MLSRVAENLYWLGRYLERAENLARMADVQYYASVELGEVAADAGATWSALIAATGGVEPLRPVLPGAEPEAAVAIDEAVSAEQHLLYSAENPSSLRSTVAYARGLARELREHVSSPIWEEINALHFAVAEAPQGGEAGLHEFSEAVRHSVAAVYGRFDNTVPHSEGREWFRSGVYIERADMTSRIVDAKYFILLPSPADVGGSIDRVQWISVLRSAGAWEAFRRRSHGVISGPAVADMLIFDVEFPRSLVFCVRALRRHLARATHPASRRASAQAGRELALLQTEIEQYDIHSVIAAGLHEFLDTVQARLIEIDRVVTTSVFRAVPELAR